MLSALCSPAPARCGHPCCAAAPSLPLSRPVAHHGALTVAPAALAGEMITPTGACLLRALVADGHYGPPPQFRPVRTGYGAGETLDSTALT